MTKAEAIAAEMERALEKRGTKERAVKEKAYLKSELEHFGCDSASVEEIVKAARKDHALDHDVLIGLVRALWKKPIHELRASAVVLLVKEVKKLEPGDLPLLEKLVRESKTWAYVDALAANVIGPLVVRNPALNEELDRFAKDGDFWIRRTAMLALLRPLREGGGDFARFARYADAMIEEKEFFIRKAIGWILRDTSKKQPKLVIDFIAPRAHRASGVTIREAVKYLPAPDQKRILAAYTAAKGR